MYALQLCIFKEVISLVPQLQCVKKGHSIELRSQKECHSFLSKAAAMWEWHSFFSKSKYIIGTLLITLNSLFFVLFITF